MGKLVAVRPNATVAWDYEGVTFQIGIVPRMVYGQFLDASQEFTSGKAKGSVLLDAQMKLVRFAVKGHSGLKFQDGEDVPFKAEAHNLNGKTHEVVSDETLDAYYSAGVLGDIATRVLAGTKAKEGGDSAGNG